MEDMKSNTSPASSPKASGSGLSGKRKFASAVAKVKFTLKFKDYKSNCAVDTYNEADRLGLIDDDSDDEDKIDHSKQEDLEEQERKAILKEKLFNFEKNKKLKELEVRAQVRRGSLISKKRHSIHVEPSQIEKLLSQKPKPIKRAGTERPSVTLTSPVLESRSTRSIAKVVNKVQDIVRSSLPRRSIQVHDDTEEKTMLDEEMLKYTLGADVGNMFADDADSSTQIKVKEAKKRHVWIDKIDQSLSSMKFSILMIVMTIVALYVDDFHKAFLPITSDNFIFFVLVLCLVFFSLEWVALCVVRKKYFLSLFFWLDFIATVSIVFDFNEVYAVLISSMGGKNDVSDAQNVRSAKAARVGARATKILRIMRALRVIRFLRIFKLFKYLKQAKREDVEQNDDDSEKESSLWSGIADVTSEKLIIGILLMMCILPMVSIDEEVPVHEVAFLSLHNPASLAFSAPFLTLKTKTFLERWNNSFTPPVYLRLNGTIILDDPQVYSKLRWLELKKVCFSNLSMVKCGENIQSTATPVLQPGIDEVWFSTKYEMRTTAIFGILKTTFVCLVLFLISYGITKGLNQRVVGPLDRITYTLQNIADKHLSRILNEGGGEEDLLNADVLEKAIYHVSILLKKSDTLLLKLLPSDIIKCLLSGREIIAFEYTEVSVLFAQVSAITSKDVGPYNMIVQLNKIFSAMDHLAEFNKVFKVETIGDTYMVCAGCPRLTPKHATRAASFCLDCLDIRDTIREMIGNELFDFKIGMAVGSAVGGVIGFKNPRWHLFGDTINTASRMCHYGKKGHIQVTQSAKDKLSDKYRMDLREDFQTFKGKGHIATYFLRYRTKELKMSDKEKKAFIVNAWRQDAERGSRLKQVVKRMNKKKRILTEVEKKEKKIFVKHGRMSGYGEMLFNDDVKKLVEKVDKDIVEKAKDPMTEVRRENTSDFRNVSTLGEDITLNKKVVPVMKKMNARERRMTKRARARTARPSFFQKHPIKLSFLSNADDKVNSVVTEESGSGSQLVSPVPVKNDAMSLKNRVQGHN
eukprot:g2127.t1